MTIKELANFTGKNKSTIGRWVAKCNSYITDELQNATKDNPADFSLGEVEEILMNSSMSRDAVRILIDNANNKNISNGVDYEIIGKMIGMAVSAAMQPVVLQLQNINRPLQIEQPKQDYYSLVAYCSLNHIKTNISELKKMGMDLRKIAKGYDKELHKIPDERWGSVNSYPIEILDEYFQI